MRVLENLQPARVFYYFEEIAKIPHGSGNTKQISDYLVEFAKEHKLEHYQDEVNNVIMIKEATAGYENSDPIIIQGHMDMVCEKESDCNIDFEKDGLDLFVEDGFVKARGTTLGGDDGIAVAYALALLESDEYAHPRLEVVITIDEEKWHLTLVNSGYRISDSYSPDLVYVCGSGERLDRKVAEHYEKMYNAALEDGVTLTPCSGYRSYETQERNYNRKIDFYVGQGYSYDDAKIKAATIIMPPGSSEHNLGYAMDIVCVDEWFEDTDEFKWLQENAADYGFIMRYPKDKQDITKVIYEPWHWRYVGVETAKELKESGLVLEEYMGVA